MAGDKYPVAASDYQDIDRKIMEIKRQLTQKGGSPLNPEQVSTTLQMIVDNDMPEPLFMHDMRKERGYELYKEGPPHPINEGRPATVSSYSSLRGTGEISLTPSEFLRRAEYQGFDLGQHTLEYLLEHQEDIMDSCCIPGMYIVFPGTVWLNKNDPLAVYQYVPAMLYLNSSWSFSLKGISLNTGSEFSSKTIVVKVN